MLLLLLLLLPVIELYVFVQVAGSLGFAPALFWIVAATFVGVWLVKQQGLGVLRRANDKVDHGEVPTDELVNGILLLLAGGLILVPGFVTGGLGLVLLLPPTRALLRGSLKRRFQHGPIVIARSGFIGGVSGPGGPRPGSGDVGRGEVWDADSWEEPPSGPDRPELG